MSLPAAQPAGDLFLGDPLRSSKVPKCKFLDNQLGRPFFYLPLTLGRECREDRLEGNGRFHFFVLAVVSS